MGRINKQILLLTPAEGRKYKDRKDCLKSYLAGETFIFNMPGHQLDGFKCNIHQTYFSVVCFRVNGSTFKYEGN